MVVGMVIRAELLGAFEVKVVTRVVAVVALVVVMVADELVFGFVVQPESRSVIAENVTITAVSNLFGCFIILFHSFLLIAYIYGGYIASTPVSS